MTDPKDRPRIPVVKTRAPGKKPGVFDNLRTPTPLSPAGAHPIEEILGIAGPESAPVQSGPVQSEPVLVVPVQTEPVQSEPVQPEPLQPAAAPVRTSPHARRTSQLVQPGPVQNLPGRYTQWPHAFWDEVARTLQPVDAVVLAHLYRLTAGHQKRETCLISLPRLAERANVSINTVRSATRRLEDRRLIERVGVDNESKDVDLRGVEWRMLVPFYRAKESDRSEKRTGPAADPMKENPKNNEESRTLMYEIRKTALRLFGTNGPVDLATLQIALAGQGIEWNDELVAEAVEPIGREGD